MSRLFLKKKGIKIIWQYLLGFIGLLMMAIGIGSFLLPCKLSSGGFTGIGTILYYLFGISVGTVNLVLNLPLFIFAYRKLGKKFLLNLVIGTSLLSFFIDYFQTQIQVVSDPFLSAVYGGIFVGIGTAMILKNNMSTGGTDLIIVLTKLFSPSFEAGKILTMVDTIIVGLNMVFLRQIDIGLYSALAIFISGRMIDLYFEGINFRKMIYIISEHYEEISKQIHDKIQKGNTGIYAKGMYENKEKMVLMCVASRKEIAQIRQLVEEIDETAFIIISDVRKVLGEGFE